MTKPASEFLSGQADVAGASDAAVSAAGMAADPAAARAIGAQQQLLQAILRLDQHLVFFRELLEQELDDRAARPATQASPSDKPDAGAGSCG